MSTAGVARAQGGPPLLTDDPDTPGPGYWEINIATTIESSADGREFEAPLADINYGVGARIQLKFEIPWLSVDRRHGSNDTGPGNSLVGVKWRFLGEEGRPLAWSVYPQLEMNTSASMAAKGLVERERRLILPTQLTFESGPIEINTEIGRIIVHGAKGGWVAGVSTELTAYKAFELLAEVHSEKEWPEPADVVINVGGRHNITRRMVLLASGGTVVRGRSEHRGRLRAYLGLQFNLPEQNELERSQQRVTNPQP